MKLDLTGLRIEVTDAIRAFTEKKIQKLSKFFDYNTLIHVTFSAENVDIRIEEKSKTYLAEIETDDIYYGIDKCIDIIERQARKERDKKEKARYDDQNNKTITDEDIEQIEE